MSLSMYAARSALLVFLVSSSLSMTLRASSESPPTWLGTIAITAVVEDQTGAVLHYYRTTTTLHLRESHGKVVDGALRVPLISVLTVIHYADCMEASSESFGHSGPELESLDDNVGAESTCLGIDAERIVDETLGYLETRDDKTVYYISIPKAFGTFACDENRSECLKRALVIGQGDLESAVVEAGDSEARMLSDGGSLMVGNFEVRRDRSTAVYNYSVMWRADRYIYE